MKRLLVVCLLALVPCAAGAAPLKGARLTPDALACVFDPNCVPPTFEDSADKLDLPGAEAGGLMLTRTLMGRPGSMGEGLHAYLYRADLSNARGTQTLPAIQSLGLDFGMIERLDYDRDGSADDYFVLEEAGAAFAAPDFGDQTGSRLAFHYYDGVRVGQATAFIGIASRAAPQTLKARATELLSASIVDAFIRVPFYDPCGLRPDLNNNLTAAQRDVLDDLVLGFIDECVIGKHYTPNIHSTANLLPWHRTYVGELENYLTLQGHPEFVPFPAWDAANPIPAEFQDVDPACTTADTAICPVNAPPEGFSSCAPLVDTTPNVARPAHLVYPALCDYATRDELTSGGVAPARPGLNGYHGSGHVSVGGAMGTFHSPAANIFWGWHSNVDNIWKEWECRCQSIIAYPIDFFPIDILTPCRIRPCWILWYPFEDPRVYDPTGVLPLQYRDLQGAENPAIPVGGPTTIRGMVGTALSFDGVDDFVMVPDHPELMVGLEDFAADLWVRTGAAGVQPLIAQRDQAGAGFSFFLMNGMPTLEIDAARGQPVLMAGAALSVADGEWHHVAFSVDRDNPMGGRLFVDGRAVATFDPLATRDLDLMGGILIGRDDALSRAGEQLFLKGDLDELDLLRRGLKPEEVLGIQQAGPAGKPGALPQQEPIVAREICNGRAIGEPGTRVTIPITLDDGGGVAGFQVDLAFDPAVLTPVAVMPGPDTAAVPGWSVVMAPVGPGLLRILGESSPPAGLAAGPREVARVQFDIAPGAPAGASSLSETNCVLGDDEGLSILCQPCANPGGVIVRTASAFRFRPLPAFVGVDAFDPLPFPVAVEALDAFGGIATGYDRTASLTIAGAVCPADRVVPPALPFAGGVGGPAPISLYCCTEGATGFPLSLVATDAPLEITGTSDGFLGIGKGDVDANGMTNVLDVLRDVRMALGQSVAQPPAASFQAWAGDMLDDHCLVDRMINVLDVLRVRNASLGRMPLCPCEGPFANGEAGAQPVAAAPLGVRLEKAGPRAWLVVVSGAADLGGLQVDLRGAGPDTTVTAGGLAAGRGWQVFTEAGRANAMRVVAFAGESGGVSGDGAVLRITGAGRPKIAGVIASDQDGRPVPQR